MVEPMLPPQLSEPNERRSAVQQAQRHIESLIDLRRVKPGQRLPASAVLAAQVGVSRPAVLQALKILGDQGRVLVRPGRGGTWVSGHAPDNLQARVARAWEQRETIIQMAYLRQMLEPGVARFVAERGMSPELLAEARRMSAGVRPTTNANRDERRACDTELHLLIARATEMPVVESFVSFCRREVAAAFDVMTWSDERAETYSDEHEALLDAIERQDATTAAELAYRHVAETTAQLETVLMGPGRRTGAVEPGMARATAIADELHLVAPQPMDNEGELV